VTHTMIPGLITSWSKIHLCYKTKLKVMDVVVADKAEALKEENMGPPGPCQVDLALGTPCLGLVGVKT